MGRGSVDELWVAEGASGVVSLGDGEGAGEDSVHRQLVACVYGCGVK